MSTFRAFLFLLDQHTHTLLRLLKKDHALLNLPCEDLVRYLLGLEVLPANYLVQFGEVAQNDAPVPVVANIDYVQHVQDLKED